MASVGYPWATARAGVAHPLDARRPSLRRREQYGRAALRHPTAVPHTVGTGPGLLPDHVLRLRSRATPLLARHLVLSNIRGPKHLCFGPRTFYPTKIRLFALKHQSNDLHEYE